MKTKNVVFLLALFAIGLAGTANADVYFRNFRDVSHFPVDQFYAVFRQSPHVVPQIGKRDTVGATADSFVFQDTNGKVDLNSRALDGTTLQSALDQKYNHLPLITVHTASGGYYDAAVALSSSFDPDTYVYDPKDVLLVTIIDMKDQKKFGVNCMGDNPCAVLEKIGTQQ